MHLRCANSSQLLILANIPGRSARQRIVVDRDPERIELLLSLACSIRPPKSTSTSRSPTSRRRAGSPIGLLPVKSEGERLELDETAQRRVAAQLPVRLQPPDALRNERERTLDPTQRDTEALHDSLEHLDVLGHLTRKPLQESAELAARVLRRRPPCKLPSCHSESELIVEVDPEQPHPSGLAPTPPLKRRRGAVPAPKQ